MRPIFLLIYPDPQIYIAHQVNSDEHDKVGHTEAECDNARIEQHDARCLDTLPEATGEGLLSQAFVKKLVDIPEHHSLSLSILMAQRITRWCFLNSQVVDPTSYSL